MQKLAKVIAGNIEDLKEYKELRVGLVAMTVGMAAINIAVSHLMLTVVERFNRR